MKKIIALIFFITMLLASVALYFVYTGFNHNSGLERPLQNFVSLQTHLAQLPELVISDNHEWEDPSYTTFYKSIQPTWFNKVLQFFHLQKDDPWSIDRIAETLQIVVADQKKFQEKGEYAVHITAQQNTKFVIWGDLFGAVHSLSRDLEYFREQKIIDDQFVILQPNYYFIFLGNVIRRSPYSLETLHIILLLIERNPGKVFYLKGKQESNDYWKNFNFKKEISTLSFTAQSKNIITYESLISDLFFSLPGALYITGKDATRNVIVLSNQPHSYALQDINQDQFFGKDVGSVDYIGITSHTKVTKQIEPIAIIKGGKDIKTASTTHGLTLLEPDQGAITWSVISCPTQIYQEFSHFYEDTFVMLTLGSTLQQATLQLMYQDVRNKTGFQPGDLFNLVTGQIIYEFGVTSKPSYFIGSTMPLTRSLSDSGQHMKMGMTALINQSNQKNYLDGHFVKAIILDDQYMPDLALKNIEILRNTYKIDTLLLPLGSPTLAAYIDLVLSGKITVIFPATGSPDFRKKENKHIVNWRASYQEEAHALMEYMIAENAAKKFAFFYQDDAYGLGPLATAHEILKAKGITDWVDIPYNKVGTNLEESVKLFHKSQADAIGFFSISTITAEFIRQVGIETIFSKKLFGISFLADHTFRKFLEDRGISMLFSSVVPNPKTNDLEIVKEFRALMDINNYPYDIFSLEAYIGTSLYLEALKSIKDNVTAEKIMQYFESYKNFTFKGLAMTFDPNSRGLSQNVWLETSSDQWKEVKFLSQQSLPVVTTS